MQKSLIVAVAVVVGLGASMALVEGERRFAQV